jgi:hypothetical protein
MQKPCLDPHEVHDVAATDISAMIAMLDYLITEVSRIDGMSTQCLILARKSLTESIAQSQARGH